MTLPSSRNRKREELDRWERLAFVGREAELQTFLDWVTNDNSGHKALNLHGTGGIGKSFMLSEFRRRCASVGVHFLLIDCRMLRTPSDFTVELLRSLRLPSPAIAQDLDRNELAELCLDALQNAFSGQRLVLALDTFEEIGELEDWLRDEILVYLDGNSRAVVSGRYPLRGSWTASPAWRQWLLRMPLNRLEYSAVQEYAYRNGIVSENKLLEIWTRTKGHPLTLSLLVATLLAKSSGPLASDPKDEEEAFAQVVETWLREVPDPEMREWVEAASVLRLFNQELLSFVLDREVPAERFRELSRYSFVQKVARGWMLHDLLRGTISDSLKKRAPDFHQTLWRRCVLYYSRKLKQSARKNPVSWDNAEFFYYIGNQLIHALFYQQPASYDTEPLTASNWDEAKRYCSLRYETVKESLVRRFDPATGRTYEYIYTKEDSLYGLKHIRLEELFELDSNAVRLIRDPSGEVCGLTVMIPIHERTLDYLLTRPLSSTYFSSLSDDALQELRVPANQRAGYFVKTLDVMDPLDDVLMQTLGLIFITQMLSTGFIVAAPPPHPLPRDIFTGLGCEIAQVYHYDYEPSTPTPYFFMDTRGRKLHQFLDRTIAAMGVVDEEAEEREPSVPLTRREKEVLDLLLQGRSNAEIADMLYLSEPTVKKHIFHIFRKKKVGTRAQLTALYARFDR